MNMSSMRVSPPRFRATIAAAAFALVALGSSAARADAVDSLRDFVRQVQAAQSPFTQVVTAPDGVKKKNSSGTFEFARPNRFRFEYIKPYPQLIVGDGSRVWLHDQDLQQVTVRAMDKALGSTPAALLSGEGLDKDFDIKADASSDGLEWALALPRNAEASSFQSMRVGFKGKALAAIEVLDKFGQKTRLQFGDMRVNHAPANDRFSFKPPAGVDVLQQ